MIYNLLGLLQPFKNDRYVCVCVGGGGAAPPRPAPHYHSLLFCEGVYMVQQKIKVLQPLYNTSYLVGPEPFDLVISSDRSPLIIGFLLFSLTI